MIKKKKKNVAVHHDPRHYYGVIILKAIAVAAVVYALAINAHHISEAIVSLVILFEHAGMIVRQVLNFFFE